MQVLMHSPSILTSGYSPSAIRRNWLPLLVVRVDFLTVVVNSDELKMCLNAGPRMGRFALMMPRMGTMDESSAILEKVYVMSAGSSSKKYFMRTDVMAIILEECATSE